MTRERGFTLIELFVTVAVLAILVAWAVPSFSKLIEKRRLIGAAEIVYEELVRARTEAVKRSKPIIVDFSADNSIGITDDVVNRCDAGEDSTNLCTLDYDNDSETDDDILMRVTDADLANLTMKGRLTESTTPIFYGESPDG